MLQDIFESRIYFLFNWWWWTLFQISEMLWKMSLIKTFRWPKHDYFRGVLQWMCYASLKSIWWPVCPEHDDVIKWKHFPRYWSFVRGIHQWVVTGEFSTQRPVTRSFDVFFDLRQNKPLSKQSKRWWFPTPSHSLWRHCDEYTLAWKSAETTGPISKQLPKT